MKAVRPNATPEVRRIVGLGANAAAAGSSPDKIVSEVAKTVGLFPSHVRKILTRFEVIQ